MRCWRRGCNGGVSRAEGMSIGVLEQGASETWPSVLTCPALLNEFIAQSFPDQTVSSTTLVFHSGV